MFARLSITYRLIAAILLLSTCSQAQSARNHYKASLSLYQSNGSAWISIRGTRSTQLMLKLKKDLNKGPSFKIDKYGARQILTLNPKFYRGINRRHRSIRAALTIFTSGDKQVDFHDGRFLYTAKLKQGRTTATLRRASKSLHPICGSEELSANISYLGAETTDNSEFKAHFSSASSNYSKEISLKTIADPELLAQNGSNATQTNESVLAIVNAAQAAYDPLGIRLYVVNQDVYSHDVFQSTDSSQLLSGMSSFSLGTADLTLGFFGRDFDGSVIGLAYVGVVCSAREASYAVIQANLAQFSNLSLAHELGHNLGAGHVSGTPSSLMNAVLSSNTPLTFSSESELEVEQYLSSNDQCLLDYPSLGGQGNQPLPKITAKSSKNGTFSLKVTNSSSDLYCTHNIYAATSSKFLINPKAPGKAILLKSFTGSGANKTFKVPLLGDTVKSKLTSKYSTVYFVDAYSCGEQENLSPIRSFKLKNSKKASLVTIKWLSKLKKMLANQL